jgi:hypothetical protein
MTLRLLAAPAPRYFLVRVTGSAGVNALDELSFEEREVFVEIRGHNPQGPQPCVPHEARAQG